MCWAALIFQHTTSLETAVCVCMQFVGLSFGTLAARQSTCANHAHASPMHGTMAVTCLRRNVTDGNLLTSGDRHDPTPLPPFFYSNSRRPLFKPCARTRIRWRVSWHTNLPRGRDSRGRASRRVTARCHRRAVARGEGTLASHGWAGLGRDGDKRRRAA